MKKVMFVFLGFTLSSCGLDLTKKNFKKEKNDRIEAQKDLRSQEFENQLLVEMLKNVVSTNSYYWAFVNSHYGYPIDTYDDAERICSKIGFDLPTSAMVSDEGIAIDGIKNLPFAGQNFERWIFIRSDNREQVLKYLVCAKQK